MSFPTEVIRLQDGRYLEFGRHGHPQGKPVLFFHGFIGSHNQARMAHDAAVRHGITLIAPNRPGVGRSTPYPRKAIAEVVPDVVELTAALGMDQFAVIGASGGAPYALACLAHLPERIPLAVVVSGLGPVKVPEMLASMKRLARVALTAGQRWPTLTRWSLTLWARLYRRNPEAFLDRLMRTWSGSDQTLFTRPDIRALFLADLHESLASSEGPAALTRELALYFHWGFQLNDIPSGSRIVFWHGRDDILVPPAMSAFMASQVPGAERHLRPGGHFMVVNHADEVIEHAMNKLSLL